MLVEQILKGIDDNVPVLSHLNTPSPLDDLVKSYKKYGIVDTSLPVFDELMTGNDFKKAISQMDPEVQVLILGKYSVATKSLSTPMLYAEDPEKTDTRRHKLWLIKFTTVTFAAVVLIVVGASMAIAYRAGVVDNALVQTMMTTATEIFKLIFSTTSI